MDELNGRLRFIALIVLLSLSALLLGARIVFWYISDPYRFPINTIKIVANYHHISREQLESILTPYRNKSYFSLPLKQLQAELLEMEWTDIVQMERLWPDTLKIVVVEKQPVAVWNGALMTSDGRTFAANEAHGELNLPHLNGPLQQQQEVLQNYQKLSKLLDIYGMKINTLFLRENQAWELVLANGVELRLGKRDLEKRLMRFCKAYASLFANKSEQLASVDLRYARGMAVQWRSQ